MYVVIFIGGIVLGMLIAALIFTRKLIGTLLITQDDEGSYLSLALDKNVNDISNKKYVTMRIRQINRGYYE